MFNNLKKVMLMTLIFFGILMQGYSITNDYAILYNFESDTSNYGNLAGYDATNFGVSFVPESILGNAGEFILAESDYAYYSPIISFLRVNSAFTYSLWLKVNAFGTNQVVYNHFTSQNDRTGMSIDATGLLRAGVYNGIFYDSDAYLPLNEWTYVTFVYDSADVTHPKLYFNGVLQTGITNNGISIYNTNTGLFIGRRNQPDSYFNGYMDEIKIYDRALSDLEVSELYSEYIQNVGININNPISNFNYTYDVSELLLNITTDYSSVCDYTYNNITILMNTIDNYNFTSNFIMGTPINETLQFNINFECYSAELNMTELKTITFYRQPEPLGFEILIPQNNQIFNYDTQTIEFHMLTNYVSTCSHMTTNSTIFEEFTQTDSSVHKTNFSVLPEYNTYYTIFKCYAGYVDEWKEVNVTFYIDEMPTMVNGQFVTQILTDTGGGVGGFLTAINGVLPFFIITLLIGGSVVGLVYAITRVLNKGLGGKK